MDGLTLPHFLGRLRHKRLNSYQMVGHKKLCLEAQAAHLFLQGLNGRGPIFPPDHMYVFIQDAVICQEELSILQSPCLKKIGRIRAAS